jgi:folylpolyglutamate synthase
VVCSFASLISIVPNVFILPDLTAVSTPEKELAQLLTQEELASAWSALNPSFPASHIHVLPSIQHAANCVWGLEPESCAADVNVLVTGSLHLVGGLIEAASLSSVAL